MSKDIFDSIWSYEVPVKLKNICWFNSKKQNLKKKLKKNNKMENNLYNCKKFTDSLWHETDLQKSQYKYGLIQTKCSLKVSVFVLAFCVAINKKFLTAWCQHSPHVGCSQTSSVNLVCWGCKHLTESISKCWFYFELQNVLLTG